MKHSSLTCLVVFLLLTHGLRSQWSPCQGIEGGNISDVIHHDTSIFITASGSGVFKKGIGELLWSENILNGAFYTIRSTGAGLFCHGYYYTFRSLDNGTTWDEPFPASVEDLETTDSVVFIVTYEEVLRSFDQGNTWSVIHPFYSIPAYEQNLRANDHWIISVINFGDSVSYSDDHGDTWTSVPLPDSTGFIGDAFMTDSFLWLSYRKQGGHSFDKISAYDLNASTWITLNDSIPPGTDVRTFFVRDSILRCGTGHGVFHFDFQDSVWVSDNNEGLEKKYISAVCVIGDSTWAATPSGPFFKSGNSDWLPDYNNLFQREVSHMFRNGNNLYALSGDKIYYSDSVETGFEVLNTEGLFNAYEIIITDSAWYAASSAGFLISVDSGSSWVSHSEGLEGKAIRDIAVTSGYYFCAYPGVFRTRADSIAWERVPNNIGTATVFSVSSMNDILFAAHSAGLHRSDDNGMTFQHVPESGTAEPGLHVESETLYMLKHTGPVLSTSGNCTAWENYISGFIDYTLLSCMDVYDNSTILGGALYGIDVFDYFLEYYEDPGEEGVDIRDDLPYCSYPFISTVYNDNGMLFACPNSNGLYYRDDFLVDIEEDPADKLVEEKVQIYPNPASDQIIISGYKDDQMLQVKIFNSKGQSLLSGRLYNNYLDVSDLSPGLYIIEIYASGELTRKKIMIF